MLYVSLSGGSYGRGRIPAKRRSDAKVSIWMLELLVKESNHTCMALDLGIYRGQNLYGLVVIGRGL